LDNLTVGDTAQAKLPSLTLTQEASLNDREGCKKKRSGGLRRGTPAVIRALQKVRRDRQWVRKKNLEAKFVAAITLLCL
jgi:hypothetical protein